MKLGKKGIFIIAVMMVFGLAFSAFAESGITVKIDGGDVDFSVYDNVLPYIEDGRTLIPIRAIAEKLGFDVDWDAVRKMAVLDKDDTKIQLTIDSKLALVNGEERELDVPARIVESRTFVPLRFVSENLGLSVDWDAGTRTVLIVSNAENSADKGEFSPHGGPMQGENSRPQGNMGGAAQNDAETQALIDESASKFAQYNFEDPDANITLEYSLYTPENYDEKNKYPLIMFIPDATGAGKSAKEIVEQYYGADIWVTAEEQEKHESFVLVPAFSGTVTDDNWNTSEQIESAVKLINNLVETYSIDENRLYTTGQSMGCMTSLYLNSKYPDLFAASMFVSGQWDISVLKPLESAKFFYITAGGDQKASGGQDEVKAMFDADGIKYSYGEWDAQLSEAEQNANVEKLLAEGCNANMVRFTTGTVLNGASGQEHMASFNYGYKLTAARDWLFKQSK